MQWVWLLPPNICAVKLLGFYFKPTTVVHIYLFLAHRQSFHRYYFSARKFFGRNFCKFRNLEMVRGWLRISTLFEKSIIVLGVSMLVLLQHFVEITFTYSIIFFRRDILFNWVIFVDRCREIIVHFSKISIHFHLFLLWDHVSFDALFKLSKIQDISYSVWQPAG